MLAGIRIIQKKSGPQKLSRLYTKLACLKNNYVRQLARWIVDQAVKAHAYGIVLEHLGRMKGRGRHKDRIHRPAYCLPNPESQRIDFSGSEEPRCDPVRTGFRTNGGEKNEKTAFWTDSKCRQSQSVELELPALVLYLFVSALFFRLSDIDHRDAYARVPRDLDHISRSAAFAVPERDHGWSVRFRELLGH